MIYAVKQVTISIFIKQWQDDNQNIKTNAIEIGKIF